MHFIGYRGQWCAVITFEYLSAQECDRGHSPLSSLPQCFQIAKPRHKISVISRVFPSRFKQVYIYFRFRVMSFSTKICQTVVAISSVRQFNEFLKSNFGRVFDIRPFANIRPLGQLGLKYCVEKI